MRVLDTYIYHTHTYFLLVGLAVCFLLVKGTFNILLQILLLIIIAIFSLSLRKKSIGYSETHDLTNTNPIIYYYAIEVIRTIQPYTDFM